MRVDLKYQGEMSSVVQGIHKNNISKEGYGMWERKKCSRNFNQRYLLPEQRREESHSPF